MAQDIDEVSEENIRHDSDDLLEATVGHFGRWQCLISVLMALLKLPVAWFSLSIVFLAPPTQFWCKPSEAYANLSDTQWINTFTANNSSTLTKEGLNEGYCTIIDINSPNGTVSCPNGFSYNKSVFHSSIVTEWDLVCGHQGLIDLSQITFMLGILIGNILYGVLADKLGRKSVLMTCIVLQAVFGIIASFVPWYWVFIISRFLLAIFNGGTIVTSFVMCMEIVGGKWRTIVPILYQIPFGFGNSIMAGLAYFIRDWRLLHCSLSVLSCLFILYYCCLPESPRWLLAVGRREEAMNILYKAAKMNSKNTCGFDNIMTELSNITTTTQKKPTPFFILFSTHQMRKRSILLFLNWTICGVTFFAFCQFLGHVSGNIFFSVATGGLIVLPGTFLCVYLVAKCGRKISIACSHTATALCFLAILAVPKGSFPQDWPRVVFAGCGIIALSISMPAMYLFTGELFPTVGRNAGVGASVMFSRVGSMIAPLVVSLQGVGEYLPLLILALGAFIEALLVLPLPETKGKALPETIQDIEKPKEIILEMTIGDYIEVPKNLS